MQRGWKLDPEAWKFLYSDVLNREWRKTYLEETYQYVLPEVAGVYLICAAARDAHISRPEADKLATTLYNAVYAGQATNLRRRFLQHVKGYGNVTRAKSVFRRLHFWFAEAESRSLDRVEQGLISALGPTANDKNVVRGIAGEPVPAGSIGRKHRTTRETKTEQEMNLYPGMRARMGRWSYFVIKMTMRELAENVKFASDVNTDRTLDEAIQRTLNESRVKKDIVTYLTRQQDRFFASVVVAAIEGDPKWYPVSIEDDPRFEVFKDDNRLNDTFGVLSFDGTQNYYALDGQHRLSAVKALIDPASPTYGDAPEGFATEEISVMIVVPEDAESQSDFMVRYRRLFGNLNRYAKPMDQVTNIIMDEDDVFAILTRRLITDHEFFQAPGRQMESVRIKTTKGKNLKASDSYFSSLEALYEINITLLTSRKRRDAGWDTDGIDSSALQRFRPDEELIDSLDRELKLYWNAILEELEILRRNPTEMRSHSIDDDYEDNLLFWPIGQALLVDVTRDLLDQRQDLPDEPSTESVKNALAGLSAVEWNFHKPPWRHLLLIPTDNTMRDWKIRSEDRKVALAVGKRIVKWQLGLDELDAEQIVELRANWEGMLLPALPPEQVESLWKDIENGAIR
jgi:DNA sulfur modification protein DndB